MKDRRILRLEGDAMRVAAETPFESEAELHEAIAAHPEVLPNEDLGVGPLVALASELDLGSGPMDLLAASPEGQLAIIEFKRGTENPDVRKVVAQVLDYGSALWDQTYEDVDAACTRCGPGEGLSIQEMMVKRLDTLGYEGFDAEVFASKVSGSLDRGDFLFLYVGRDLDERSRRIMTYLAEGPRMRFFGIEVNCFRTEGDQGSVMVPRAAFIPSWITAGSGEGDRRRSLPASKTLESLPDEVRNFIQALEAQATALGFAVQAAPTGKRILTPGGEHILGVYYGSSRGVEFPLKVLRERVGEPGVEQFLVGLREFLGREVRSRDWPNFALTEFVGRWPEAKAKVFDPYFALWRSPPV